MNPLVNIGVRAARAAGSAADYRRVYASVLAEADRPVLLHWLGEMFDPQLAGYWGASAAEAAADVLLDIIADHCDKVDGVKISLLSAEHEIALRRRLPAGVRMYTGDDYHYPQLIKGDAQGYSDALLGIFDPIAPLAAAALNHLAAGETARYDQLMTASAALSRVIFCPPVPHYKTGVVFLAWLNGFQNHFIMLGGAQARRPLRYFAEVFRHADQIGLLRDPELAAARMTQLLALHGIGS